MAQGAGGEEKEKKEKKKEEKKEEKLQKHEKEDKKKEKDLKAEKQEKEEKEEQEEEHAAAREKNISSRWQADTQVLAPVASNKNEGITPKDRDSPSKNGGIISKKMKTHRKQHPKHPRRWICSSLSILRKRLARAVPTRIQPHHSVSRQRRRRGSPRSRLAPR